MVRIIRVANRRRGLKPVRDPLTIDRPQWHQPPARFGAGLANLLRKKGSALADDSIACDDKLGEQTLGKQL
jgi:hypothetical protein